MALEKLWAQEQIMFNDKKPSLLLPQMETIVFTILQIFFTALAVWGILSDIPEFLLGNIRSSEVFRPIASEGQCLMEI